MKDSDFAQGVARISGYKSVGKATTQKSLELHSTWLVAMAIAIACLRAALTHFHLGGSLVWFVLFALVACSIGTEVAGSPRAERLIKYAAIGAYGAKPLLSFFLHMISK